MATEKEDPGYYYSGKEAEDFESWARDVELAAVLRRLKGDSGIIACGVDRTRGKARTIAWEAMRKTKKWADFQKELRKGCRAEDRLAFQVSELVAQQMQANESFDAFWQRLMHVFERYEREREEEVSAMSSDDRDAEVKMQEKAELELKLEGKDLLDSQRASNDFKVSPRLVRLPLTNALQLRVLRVALRGWPGLRDAVFVAGFETFREAALLVERLRRQAQRALEEDPKDPNALRLLSRGKEKVSDTSLPPSVRVVTRERESEVQRQVHKVASAGAPTRGGFGKGKCWLCGEEGHYVPACPYLETAREHVRASRENSERDSDSEHERKYTPSPPHVRAVHAQPHLAAGLQYSAYSSSSEDSENEVGRGKHGEDEEEDDDGAYEEGDSEAGSGSEEDEHGASAGASATTHAVARRGALEEVESPAPAQGKPNLPCTAPSPTPSALQPTYSAKDSNSDRDRQRIFDADFERVRAKMQRYQLLSGDKHAMRILLTARRERDHEHILEIERALPANLHAAVDALQAAAAESARERAAMHADSRKSNVPDEGCPAVEELPSAARARASAPRSGCVGSTTEQDSDYPYDSEDYPIDTDSDDSDYEANARAEVSAVRIEATAPSAVEGLGDGFRARAARARCDAGPEEETEDTPAGQGEEVSTLVLAGEIEGESERASGQGWQNREGTKQFVTAAGLGAQPHFTPAMQQLAQPAQQPRHGVGAVWPAPPQHWQGWHAAAPHVSACMQPHPPPLYGMAYGSNGMQMHTHMLPPPPLVAPCWLPPAPVAPAPYVQ